MESPQRQAQRIRHFRGDYQSHADLTLPTASRAHHDSPICRREDRRPVQRQRATASQIHRSTIGIRSRSRWTFRHGPPKAIDSTARHGGVRCLANIPRTEPRLAQVTNNCVNERTAFGARGPRDLQRLPYLPVVDRPTFRCPSDERNALRRASSRARLSGSGSMVSGSYITRTTRPTPSITPLRTSPSGESLMAAPLACPPTFQKTTWQESSSSTWPRRREHFH